MRTLRTFEEVAMLLIVVEALCSDRSEKTLIGLPCEFWPNGMVSLRNGTTVALPKSLHIPFPILERS